MYPQVDTRFPSEVEVEVQAAYTLMFPKGDRYFVHKAFGWAIDCFSGNHREYQAIDARYHDFEHTLQGTLCLARLLRGRHLSGDRPLVTQPMFELGLLAILLHDSGYLKRREDVEGTGAKYTFIHVQRSTDFASLFLAEKGYTQAEILAVQNMIRCTGVNVNLESIPFQSDLERLLGYTLGTADLLGQMSAFDYVDKLPILYLEFAESARSFPADAGSQTNFTSAEDLMRRTPGVWGEYVKPKIAGDFGGLHRYLADPYPDGPNEYMERVEANMIRLRRQLALSTA
jgi:hypothetical protein